jgi:hypothetical protein
VGRDVGGSGSVGVVVGVHVGVGSGVSVGVAVLVGVGVGGYKVARTSRTLTAASTGSQPSMASTFLYCSRACSRSPAFQ